MIIKEYEPEFVFHLAAQSLVGYSYKYPRKTYQTNIMGTVNVFEAVKEYGKVKVLINVTSDKCYKIGKTIRAYKENDPLGGDDPYSSSKGCSEIISSAFRKSFFNKEDSNTAVATVRAGNVIGGEDWSQNRLIPDCVRAIINNKKIEIRNPEAVRPWQFVLEPLRGYMLLAEKLYSESRQFAGAWNFGPGSDSTVKVGELVEQFIEKWGKGSWSKKKGENIFKETKLLNLNIEKARTFLKWEPFLKLKDSVKFTVDWYKKQNVSYDFDVDQINKYLEIGG